jgi:iron complex transport system substrate-binding protein
VLTQDTCDICDATAVDVQRALEGIQPPPQLLILRPRTVSEILESIMAVGQAAGVPDRAGTLVARLRTRRTVPCLKSGACSAPTTAGIVRRGEPAGSGGALDSRARNTGWWSG